MAKTAWKAGTLLAPVPPALISCAHNGKDNLITIAWTGIINSDPAKTYISVRKQRYSYDLIKNSGEFVINLPSQHIIRSVDFCGVKSGREVDKFSACKLTREKASQLNCPMVAESPVSIECKVTDIVELGTHDMFIAEIVAIQVEDKYIDEDGKLDLRKAGVMFYSHGEYFAQGKKIGQMGYSVKKKRTKNPKLSKKKESK